MENVIIAGSGPAGLTAAIYTARSNLKPLVIEGLNPGGQLVVSYEVENYPGFVEPISGTELMERFKKQAERFGARFKPGTMTKAEKAADYYKVYVDSDILESRTIVIATGAQARRLPIPSEKIFYGRGVSGCATCDGAFFRNKEVLVVGGGNTAMEDAVFLTKFASKVTIIHRRDYLRAAPAEINKVKKNQKIKWLIPWIIEEILGENTVSGAVIVNPQTGEKKEIKCDGIFAAIGHDPNTEPFKDLIELDEDGFIKTKPNSTRTSTPGLFACGDVMDPVFKQAVLAAGHGCMAAMEVEKYLGLKE
ncbi:MAG: thioredoxin-disulfide reductase [bacterium]